MAILNRRETVYAPRDFENEPPSLKLGAPGPGPGPGPGLAGGMAFMGGAPYPPMLGGPAGFLGGGPAPPDFSFSAIIKSIARLAEAICGRVPWMLHTLSPPLSLSWPLVINCTLAPVSASTRRRFSPPRPMINPTRDASMLICSMSGAGDRVRWALPYRSPRGGGEYALLAPRRGGGLNERSRSPRPYSAPARPRRSSRNVLYASL